MISIVICSINPVFLAQVKENISSTIGVEHEWLIWDNRGVNKGICEVYNQLASQARFPYLCFVHEDVLFETRNWGKTVLDLFADASNPGVIGVAGNSYKSKAPSGWYSGIKQLDCANIIHRYPTADEHVQLKPDNSSRSQPVVCVDGVFICCRKEIWKQVKFDEKNLTGFHFYDLDFSLRASEICSVIVSFEILMIHITKGGDFGDNWVKVALKYHDDVTGMLPKSIDTKSLPSQIEIRIIRTWLDVLKDHSVSWSWRWKWINQQNLFRYPSLYYSIAKFLLYKPLGLRRIHKPRKH